MELFSFVTYTVPSKYRHENSRKTSFQIQTLYHTTSFCAGEGFTAFNIELNNSWTSVLLKVYNIQYMCVATVFGKKEPLRPREPPHQLLPKKEIPAKQGDIAFLQERLWTAHIYVRTDSNIVIVNSIAPVLLLYRPYILLRLVHFCLEDGASRSLRNFNNHLPDNMMLHSRKTSVLIPTSVRISNVVRQLYFS